MALRQTEERYASSLLPGEDANEVFSSDLHSQISDHPSPPQSQSHILLRPLSHEDEAAVGDLIDCESQTLYQVDYLERCRSRSVNLTARQDSINWILKVHAHYHFRPVTAMLAVNYLDRLLSTHSLPEDGWSFQLLSVTCLSIAAKMEELNVPLLPDLQICEPKFLFEARSIQRMELFVMANLNWRLRSVTPFDFIHLFVSTMIAMPSSSARPDQSAASRILSSASDLILGTLRVIDFLGFRPSAIAAAAVLSAAGEGPESPVAFHQRVDKEMARSCHQLMEEYLLDTCPAEDLKSDEAVPSAVQPPSPVGVLDAAACGSCDSRSESHGGEPSRPTKRMRSSASDVQEP
ncbi:hypothetical protein SAY87_020962 [Trapa incisa]|uniref:Cyclin N-terminal domain-containing protein n=1 Tax=Trapa incisa TaxID=236973 RepID=A0AAN7PQB7_9MYRT|nr:hypothetical protein SAY87_020962 [Trapa incisa]